MNPTFTIILPSVGRQTLESTLESLLWQEYVPGDVILLVSDGPNAVVSSMFETYRTRLPIELRVIEGGPHNDWGHTLRNLTMPTVTTTHMLHMDDDDKYVAGALSMVRAHVTEKPSVPHIYRVRFADSGTTIWHTAGELIFANVSTVGMVHPHLPGKYAVWPPIVGGDFHFWTETQTHYPPGSLVWHDNILCIARPHMAKFTDVYTPVNYVERREPTYCVDDFPLGLVFQPKVYTFAYALATMMEVKTIVDLGCGSGDKLQPFLDADIRVIPVDTGRNVELFERRHGFRPVDFDLEQPGLERVVPAAENAIFLCCDVLEHTLNPHQVLKNIKALAVRDNPRVIILSTPDRDKFANPGGPPANPSHVREWSKDEFCLLCGDYFKVIDVQYTTTVVNFDGSVLNSTIQVAATL